MVDLKLNPTTVAGWAEWNEEFDRGMAIMRGFLLRYARRCARCGADDPARGFHAYTPKTFNIVSSIKNPVWDAVMSGREDLAVEYLEKIGAEVYCIRCIRQIPSNGRWSAILEARRLEEEQLAKEKTDA